LTDITGNGRLARLIARLTWGWHKGGLLKKEECEKGKAPWKGTREGYAAKKRVVASWSEIMCTGADPRRGSCRSWKEHPL